MKIAIASLGDPFSIGTWSGIPAHIIMALKGRQHEIIGITLERPKEPWIYDWFRRLYFRFQHKWFLSDVDPFLLKKIGAQLDWEVKLVQPDVVIVIHGDFLAYTTFKQPAVIIHDATFASLLDYYPAFSNLTNRSIEAGNLMYQLALDRADIAVYSAEWASNSAKIDYNAVTSKVYTIPFGANLPHAPASKDVKKWIKNRSAEDTCNFLFLGVDWARKGGADALKFVIELNRKGMKAKLLIAGCTPAIEPEDEKYVHKLGFLRKDVKEEAEQLEQLFIHSHALLLPSVAECYGCVYCEANAYGLPAIGRNTGGVPDIIKDGINGLLLRSGETPELLAARWAALWSDHFAYQRLSSASHQEYVDRLNYDVFVEKFEPVLRSVLRNDSALKMNVL